MCEAINTLFYYLQYFTTATFTTLVLGTSLINLYESIKTKQTYKQLNNEFGFKKNIKALTSFLFS